MLTSVTPGAPIGGCDAPHRASAIAALKPRTLQVDLKLTFLRRRSYRYRG
jgi:hypothetical protein